MRCSTGVAALSGEIVILIFRIAILLILYLFLWQLVAVIWRDLRRPATGEVNAPRPKGRLVVVSGDSTAYQPGHAFQLSDSTTIGRGPNNSIVLGDGFVSTNHAILTYREDGWRLADLGSRNGTWLNGERIEGEVPVRPGDLIGIGQTKLKLAK